MEPRAHVLSFQDTPVGYGRCLDCHELVDMDRWMIERCKVIDAWYPPGVYLNWPGMVTDSPAPRRRSTACED